MAKEKVEQNYRYKFGLIPVCQDLAALTNGTMCSYDVPIKEWRKWLKWRINNWKETSSENMRGVEAAIYLYAVSVYKVSKELVS